MWFVDIVVDTDWFSASKGHLGSPRARASQDTFDPDVKTEVLLYGDDETIRHVRVMVHADDKDVVHACINRNIQRWVHSLEISSALTTAHFASVVTMPGTVSIMSISGEGDEHAVALEMTPNYGSVAKAKFDDAARLFVAWRPAFKIHLHYLSRFLNSSLPPEFRWLNGYRLLEWHFMRGRIGLAKNKAYRDFLERHGANLDACLRPRQPRQGLLEETRALVAHALLAEGADPTGAEKTTDIVLKTFAALEVLVMHVMNEGCEGIQFHPNTFGAST